MTSPARFFHRFFRRSPWPLLLAAGLGLAAPAAQAHSVRELLDDCRTALLWLAADNRPRSGNEQGGRCVAYVNGFADGYRIGEYLADKVGVSLNALCLPQGPDASGRMVRALVSHLHLLPGDTDTPPQTLVAGAFAKAFSCEPPAAPGK
ncbi:MAG: hypothetical protein RIR00_709 [Pseudomonadota bacterium]|jgi:hypothetical protein